MPSQVRTTTRRRPTRPATTSGSRPAGASGRAWRTAPATPPPAACRAEGRAAADAAAGRPHEALDLGGLLGPEVDVADAEALSSRSSANSWAPARICSSRFASAGPRSTGAAASSRWTASSAERAFSMSRRSAELGEQHLPQLGDPAAAAPARSASCEAVAASPWRSSSTASRTPNSPNRSSRRCALGGASGERRLAVHEAVGRQQQRLRLAPGRRSAMACEPPELEPPAASAPGLGQQARPPATTSAPAAATGGRGE